MRDSLVFRSPNNPISSCFRGCYFYFFIDVSLMLSLQVNLGIYVTDGKYELSVLVDRAVGASSIRDGQIEIMFHRYDSFYFIPYLCYLP